ncbi:MAG: hypothetical protein J1G02_05790 [Clostridiales bacterium]|nr:hypothetical protein [Clostridiales bacterium]
MSKENIYQLVEKNYSPEKEVRKIHDILTQEIFFNHTATDDQGHKAVTTFRFFDFADKVLFPFIQDKGTCLGLAEFMARADAILEFGDCSNLSTYRITNYLEIVENLLNLYFYHKRTIERKMGYDIYYTPYNKVVFLMTELEKYLKLTKSVKKDKVLLQKLDIKIRK